MRTTSFVVAIAAFAGLAGCSTYQVTKYSVSVQNAEAFRALGAVKLSVAPFTGEGQAAATEISCRAVGPIKTPLGETYAAYVQQALVDELKVAGIFAEDAKVQIQGNLAKVDLSSHGSARWMLTLVVTIGNEPSFTLERNYGFESSFLGEKACALTSQAFMPAVQDLMNALAKDPVFAKLVAQGKV
jgi:hypothetical protein